MPLDSVQRSLSKAQTIFIAGPLLVSPAKALLSSAQIIVEFAKTILCSAATLTCATLGSSYTEFFARHTFNSFCGMVSGIGSLTYSLANIATFGLTSIWLEAAWTELKPHVEGAKEAYNELKVLHEEDRELWKGVYKAWNDVRNKVADLTPSKVVNLTSYMHM